MLILACNIINKDIIHIIVVERYNITNFERGGDEYITRIKLIDFDDLGVSFLVIIVNYIPSYFTVTNCFYFLYDIFGVFF